MIHLMEFATFKMGRDDVMARIDGKVSFPERGWAPKAGETYEVAIVGQSKSGKAQFLRRIAGPFYAVEGAQRQYGWYNTTALGKPDIEFQSGFSMGSAYYTAVWTEIPYAEALRRVDEVRSKDQEAKAEEARLQEEESSRRKNAVSIFYLERSRDPEVSALIEEMMAEDKERYGGDFVPHIEGTPYGLAVTITRPVEGGKYSSIFLKGYNNCMIGERRGKEYRFFYPVSSLSDWHG